ncbi:hypothetical protein HPP92_000575 [Vanilla planifolia]|uniref:DUF4005 domain-containing protein n=1 Tax=Vanilla planifolia TaxID=51239 RepID=A0A835S0V8_VANPL|nr:hypothetical protein HPP92_000627 [Vanilla planifolia]KAG0500503.1 hypothetical protein HPP92_000575 [Vanilla planifolia]
MDYRYFAFNGFRVLQAKKALRALKALVKLQALVRGFLVRKQAAATLHSMQALIRAQALVRAEKTRPLLLKKMLDETKSKHASYFQRRRNSISLENPDSPKILQIDPCLLNSRSSRRASCSMMDSAFSPLPSPCSRRISTPDHEWCFPTVKCRYSATAHSTPRCMNSGGGIAPSTPAKTVCGGGEKEFRRILNPANGPNYMSNTRSFEAKVRSQSLPKQRGLTVGSRKRLPLSEVVVEQARASLGSAMSSKNALVGKLDRYLELSREMERDFYLQNLF